MARSTARGTSVCWLAQSSHTHALVTEGVFTFDRVFLPLLFIDVKAIERLFQDLIAVITEPPVIDRILRHLCDAGLQSPFDDARAPPSHAPGASFDDDLRV